MKLPKILSVLFLVATVILAAVSFALLPQTVTTQIATSGTTASTMSKPLAVLLPTLLGAGGALACLFSNTSTANRAKCLVVSGTGLLVFVIMLIVNL